MKGGALLRVTTFLEFLETWKCHGIQLRSGKRFKVRERSGNLCIRGNWLWHLNKITYLYFIRTVIQFSYIMLRRIWMNKCAFVWHIARNFVWKSRGFFSVWRVLTLLLILQLHRSPDGSGSRVYFLTSEASVKWRVTDWSVELCRYMADEWTNGWVMMAAGSVLSASDKLMTAASTGNTELVLQLLDGNSSSTLEHDEVDHQSLTL